MYVIGKNDFEFINITNVKTLYDGRNMWNKVNGLEYEAPLDKATIVKDYDEAERLLGEIQENVENINFSNNDIIADILDKEHSFDKVSYSKELKIYELMPVVVNE